MKDAAEMPAARRPSDSPTAPAPATPYFAQDAAAAPALSFDTDRGSSRSRWIAGLLSVALIGWMGSGYVLPAADAPVEERVVEAAPVAVAVAESVAEEVTLHLSAEGQAVPDRITEVPSETSGEIAEVLVAKGQDVDKGTVLARIDTADRAADLARAQTDLERAERDFENAETLLERGVATADRVAETRAARATAEASLASAREAIDATGIRAPFAGRIEQLDVDPGEYVAEGAAIATIVDTTPLTVSIRVPQQALRSVRAGLPAEVTFITGETRTGEVTFVGTSADAETRTFLAEVTVDNAGGEIAAGVSAEVRIPTGTEVAHLLSPAAMSLSAEGVLGIKTLGEENIVVFNEVEIVRAESRGIWVTGLPDRATVLTVGQGFVSAGEPVTPRPAEELADEALNVAQAAGEGSGPPAGVVAEESR